MKRLFPTAICTLLLSTLIADLPTQSEEYCPPSCSSVTFSLYGDLLYLQPNGSNLYYAAEAYPFDDSIAVPAVSPNWKIYEIDPKYSFGFEVGAKAHFNDSKTSIMANWERLHSHDGADHYVTDNRNMIGPLFDIGPNSSNYKSASGKASFHFDAADLIFGKEFCFIDRLYTNFFAGASFARIHQSMNVLYKNNSTSISRNISYYSKFIGAGPEVGVDFGYRITRDFSFTGSSSLGLIMGQMQNGTTYQSTTPFLATIHVPQPNVQGTRVPNRAQLVPNFEEKLGFSYDTDFDSWGFSVGVGYMVQIYVDAVQSVDMTAPQVPPSLTPALVPDAGVYAVGFERTLSNFILSGPYASLNIDF